MRRRRTKLKVGDKVVVIAGGSPKRQNKGAIGTILRFVGDDRVIVEGVNIGAKHKRKASPDSESVIERAEQPIHLSNVMYYVEGLGKGVRLKYKFLQDGRKVRGYIHPEENNFVQID